MAKRIFYMVVFASFFHNDTRAEMMHAVTARMISGFSGVVLFATCAAKNNMMLYFNFINTHNLIEKLIFPTIPIRSKAQ